MKAGNNEHRKGLWTAEEDRALTDYISVHGKGKWNRIARETGLKRCGKSCRLRWMNYLSPDVKRGDFTEEEDDLIIRLHNLLGNRWSLIAGRVPGRTDSQVKNYWNTHLSKRLGVKKNNNNNKMNKEVTTSVMNSKPLLLLSSPEEVDKDYRSNSKGLSELPNTSDVNIGEADHHQVIITGDIIERGVMMSDNNNNDSVDDKNNDNKNDNRNNINDYESSFWFSCLEDFISPISSYCLVEPLHEQSLDILWDIGLY